jgi:type I restriction enzyme, S subunit
MSKVVPDGWKTIEVQDAFVLGRGRVISKPEIQDNRGIYPVYSSQSKDNGKMGSINTYDFDGEYITWTTDGAYAGTVFHRTGKFNCTNVCGTLKKNNSYEVDLRYVSRYLSTVAKNYVSYVGNPKLMNGVFAEIPFRLPPLPEQQKIASILTSVDDVIEKTQSQINKLQDLKKGTMNELLTRGIGHTEFKDSPVGRIPKEWEAVYLENIVSKITDGEHLSPNCVESGEPILSAKDIQENNIEIGGAKFVSSKDFVHMRKRCDPDLGDVLVVSRGATIGRCTLNRLQNPFALMGSVILIKPEKCKSLGEYLSYYLKQGIVRNKLLLLSGSSAQQAIYLKDVKDLKIHLPSLEEQQQIASILSSMDTNIEEKQRKLQQTKFLKKSLMQDLLTGRVRVTVH